MDGYSHLMQVNEEATLGVLETDREIFGRLIAHHRGRIFNTGGDSILAEFTSVVEAVRCAMAFQKDISGRKADTPDQPLLRFRIGINIGDIMIRDGDLFGNRVNIAARLEGLAEPGGICISGNVYEQVKNKLFCAFEDLGAQSVKNIAEPILVCRIAAQGRVAKKALESALKAIEVVKRAMRLSPYHDDWYNWGLMNAYFQARQLKQAILAFERLEHPSTGNHLRLAAS
ncbi:MAG TPA: adenylate/guanylate cyclase domain-containing protein [Roseibacterium sp.]|nr:adenylate/guanylate cyclase domain-containing protein [Roseibacterium sp.]